MQEKSIKINIALNTLYQILTMIIPFITTPYVSRVIGSEGIGIYSFTLSIQTYFSMFAALGTVSYGTREIARNRNDKYNRSLLFWEIELLTIFTSLVCIIVWVIFIGLSNSYRTYYVVLTMNLLNTMFDISWFFNGLEQFKYTIIKNSIFKILGVVLIFIFIKKSTDLVLYIGIMSMTTLLGTLSMWFYLKHFLCKISIKDIHIMHHLKETVIYFVPTIATSIYTVLDKTLIGTITDNSKENGYYEQASKIINMLKSLTFTALNTVLGSRISYLFAQNKIDEIRKRIDKSVNYILFVGFGIMFGLIAIADRFVPVFFGTGYSRVSILIKLLSPIIVIIGISNCLGSQYYNPAGLRKKSAIYIIIGSITNLVLNLLLIPRYWSCGAAMATIIAELIITILYILNCNNYLNFYKIIQFSWKKIISGMIMFIVINFYNSLQLKNIIIIIFQVFSGVIIYVGLLILLRDRFIIDIMNIIFTKLRKDKKIEERI